MGNIFVVTTTPLVKELVPGGVRVKMLFGNKHDDSLEIWEMVLLQALAQQKFYVRPKPCVIEKKRLEGDQEKHTEEWCFSEEGCWFVVVAHEG